MNIAPLSAFSKAHNSRYTHFSNIHCQWKHNKFIMGTRFDKFELSIYIETVDEYSLQKTIRVYKIFVKGLCSVYHYLGFLLWHIEQVFNFFDALWLDGILFMCTVLLCSIGGVWLSFCCLSKQLIAHFFKNSLNGRNSWCVFVCNDKVCYCSKFYSVFV